MGQGNDSRRASGGRNRDEVNDKPVFAKYLKELSAVALQGDAREESFYPTLAEMLAAISRP
jgi:hypothetical protein